MDRYAEVVGHELSAPTPRNPPFTPEIVFGTSIEGTGWFGLVLNTQGLVLWCSGPWDTPELARFLTHAKRCELLVNFAKTGNIT